MSTDNTKRLITCEKCGMKFQVLDKQIEKRRNTLTCPKCNETIHLADQYNS